MKEDVGTLVEPRNAQALAAGLEIALANEVTREQHEVTQQVIQKHSSTVIVKRLNDIYETEWKRIFQMSKLFKIIGTVAIINIVARLFGFGREVVIGIQYGTSTVADAIATAYTIPNFIYLVLGGALTTAFISIYHSSNMDKPLFVRKAFTTVVITATLVTLVIIVLTNPILNLFFKDLSDEDYTLVRNLFLWMMPSSIVLVMSTWMSGLLNINDRFQLRV